jgi:hypothetical protein
MLRKHAIRGAIAPILWENPGYRPMDQEITLYIFNVSQMDMAPKRLIGSTRKNRENIRLPHMEGSGRIVPIWIKST